MHQGTMATGGITLPHNCDSQDEIEETNTFTNGTRDVKLSDKGLLSI